MAPPSRHEPTSVVWGYDATEYKSSAASMNEAVAAQARLGGSRPKQEPNLNKECHVVFGEPGKKRDFLISSTQTDTTGEIHKYAAKLNGVSKKMLIKTSCTFGTDAPNYVTSTQMAQRWDKAAVQETVALRNEIRKRTGPRPTRGISYDDEVEYVSECKSQFQNKGKEFKPSIMADAVKKDLRATHFTLGDEKLQYSTTSHTDRLSKEDFIKYATPQVPPHDLRKSTVEIS